MERYTVNDAQKPKTAKNSQKLKIRITDEEISFEEDLTPLNENISPNSIKEMFNKIETKKQKLNKLQMNSDSSLYSTQKNFIENLKTFSSITSPDEKKLNLQESNYFNEIGRYSSLSDQKILVNPALSLLRAHSPQNKREFNSFISEKLLKLEDLNKKIQKGLETDRAKFVAEVPSRRHSKFFDEKKSFSSTKIFEAKIKELVQENQKIKKNFEDFKENSIKSSKLNESRYRSLQSRAENLEKENFEINKTKEELLDLINSQKLKIKELKNSIKLLKNIKEQSNFSGFNLSPKTKNLINYKKNFVTIKNSWKLLKNSAKEIQNTKFWLNTSQKIILAEVDKTMKNYKIDKKNLEEAFFQSEKLKETIENITKKNLELQNNYLNATYQKSILKEKCNEYEELVKNLRKGFDDKIQELIIKNDEIIQKKNDDIFRYQNEIDLLYREKLCQTDNSGPKTEDFVIKNKKSEVDKDLEKITFILEENIALENQIAQLNLKLQDFERILDGKNETENKICETLKKAERFAQKKGILIENLKKIQNLLEKSSEESEENKKVSVLKEVFKIQNLIEKKTNDIKSIKDKFYVLITKFDDIKEIFINDSDEVSQTGLKENIIKIFFNETKELINDISKNFEKLGENKTFTNDPKTPENDPKTTENDPKTTENDPKTTENFDHKKDPENLACDEEVSKIIEKTEKSKKLENKNDLLENDQQNDEMIQKLEEFISEQRSEYEENIEKLLNEFDLAEDEFSKEIFKLNSEIIKLNKTNTKINEMNYELSKELKELKEINSNLEFDKENKERQEESKILALLAEYNQVKQDFLLQKILFSDKIENFHNQISELEQKNEILTTNLLENKKKYEEDLFLLTKKLNERKTESNNEFLENKKKMNEVQ